MSELTLEQQKSIIEVDIERLSSQREVLQKQIDELAEKSNDGYRKLQRTNQDAERVRIEAEEEIKKIGQARLLLEKEKKEVQDFSLKTKLAKDELDKSRENLIKDRKAYNQDVEKLRSDETSLTDREKTIIDREKRILDAQDDIRMREHQLAEKNDEIGRTSDKAEFYKGETLNEKKLVSDLRAEIERLKKHYEKLIEELKNTKIVHGSALKKGKNND